MKPWQCLRAGSHILNAQQTGQTQGLSCLTQHPQDAPAPMTGTFLVCGSALYSRPCRREPGLQLQETEMRIWRLLKGFLQPCSPGQTGGARPTKQHRPIPPALPTLPGCALPTAPTKHRNPTWQAAESKRAFPEAQSKPLPSFIPVRGTQQAQLPSLGCQDEKFCSVWYHISLSLALKGLWLNFCCREGKSQV